MSETTTMTLDQWRAEADRRFGTSPVDWHFVCPVCGNDASGLDFKEAGASPDAMRSECIGRHTNGRDAFGGSGDGPCNYAGYGLIWLSPIRVTTPDGKVVHSFAFGESRKDGA